MPAYKIIAFGFLTIVFAQGSCSSNSYEMREESHRTCVCFESAQQPDWSPQTSLPAPLASRVLSRVRIGAVGDIISHGPVIRSAQQNQGSADQSGFLHLFKSVEKDLTAFDLVFANLETPVAPKQGKQVGAFQFNAPVELLSAMQHVGINLVSLANNHIYDQKREGLQETLEYLQQSGITFGGAGLTCQQARQAKIINIKKIKIGFLASSTLYNQRLNRFDEEPCASEFREKDVLENARQAKKQGADIIILSLHWGKEYSTSPKDKAIALAHRLLEGGVDVILGHHPHVLQPIEVYQTQDGRVGFVAYSLGNFVSNQSRFYVHHVQPERMGNTRDGVLLSFSVLRRRYPGGKIRVELAELLATPLWTENNAILRLANRAQKTDIRIVNMADQIHTIQRQLMCGAHDDKVVELTKQLELLRQRHKISSTILGEDLVRPLPTPKGRQCRVLVRAPKHLPR